MLEGDAPRSRENEYGQWAEHGSAGASPSRIGVALMRSNGHNIDQGDTTSPVRSRPAHPSPIERNRVPIILLITVCCKERSNWLAHPNTHKVIHKIWTRSTFWLVGNYVLMPDHLHCFCTPGTWPPHPVKKWVHYWKSQFRRAGLYDHNIWLPDCWDTQMRDRKHYDEKLAYVRMNPVRKGLVQKPADWPFQGEIHPIVWLD